MNKILFGITAVVAITAALAWIVAWLAPFIAIGVVLWICSKVAVGPSQLNQQGDSNLIEVSREPR